MAKRHPRRPGPRRLHAVGAPSSPVAHLAGLRGEFSAWAVEHGLPGHVDPRDVVDRALEIVGTAARAGLVQELGSWTPDQVSAVLTQVAEDDDGPTSLPLLFAFLADTERWQGSPDDLRACMTLAEEATDPRPTVVADLDTVVVDPALESTAVRALPVSTRVLGLLELLAPRRRVTARGALTRADLPALFEVLGLPAPDTLPRSMWDHPHLTDAFSALLAAGLVDITPPWATVTAAGHQVVAGDIEVLTGFAVRHLDALLDAPPLLAFLPHPADDLLPALAAAALGRPLPLEHVVPPVAAEALAASMSASRDDVSTSPLLAAVSLRSRYDLLVTEGFLMAGDSVAAPEGLRRVLARSVAGCLRADLGDGPALAPEPDPALAGQEWSLRVELADCDPPVWREVAVDPNLTLADLHEVMQGLFGWQDGHLHEFTVGRGQRAVRYARHDPDAEDWGDPPLDSSCVRLAQVMSPRGLVGLEYVYDFGDGWTHRIQAATSGPAAGPLPRCTGGSGASPAEDSGGPWGWQEKVAAAGDPRHPEHDDVREWLGLAPGESLDAGAFDAGGVEGALTLLRR